MIRIRPSKILAIFSFSFLPTNRSCCPNRIGGWSFESRGNTCGAKHGIAGSHPSRAQQLHDPQSPTRHCWWIIVECIHHPTRGVGSKSQEEHANCHQKLPTEKKTELETLPSHFSLLSLTKSAPSCPSNRRTGGSLPSCGSEECTSPITLSCVRAHRVFLLTFVMHAGKAQPLAPGCMENFYTQAY